MHLKKLMSFVFALYMVCLCEEALACSTILIGKDATVDGSVIIARAEDTTDLTPKALSVYSTKDIPHVLKSSVNDFNYKLLGEPIKHFAFAENEEKGGYAAAGINAAGVSVTATETTYNSQRALQVDPYDIKNGIAEDVIPRVILASVKSAREGVLLLGKIIEKQGAAEGFGVAFADKNDAWYLETASGHRWAAVRVPDDSYLVAMNQTRLQKVDLKDEKNYLGSKDLIEFATANKLYDPNQNAVFDFREVFADIVKEDVDYNYYRLWTVQNMFNSRLINDYKDGKFPLFLQPDRKITLDDVKSVFRTYYRGTQYDPYTNQNPAEPMRPLSLFRTADVHIIQMRQMADPEVANVMYVGLGMPSLSIFVPFHQGIANTHELYKHVGSVAHSGSAWWIFKEMQTMTMIDFPQYGKFVEDKIADFEQKQQLRQLDFERMYRAHRDSSVKTAGSMLTDFDVQNATYALNEAIAISNKILTDEAKKVNVKYQFINDGRDAYYANVEKMEKAIKDAKK